jgi:ArsR family transcriptional regulator, arsenate/arsenite/antimonite-responsive transcriptional repressor
MKTPQAVKALAALAQDTRLAIYRLLVQQGPEGLSAGTIAERLDIAGATLSFHLKELAHAGMVEARQDGRFVYYSANYGQMNRLLAYLTENCCEGSGCANATACVPQLKRKRA